MFVSPVPASKENIATPLPSTTDTHDERAVRRSSLGDSIFVARKSTRADQTIPTMRMDLDFRRTCRNAARSLQPKCQLRIAEDTCQNAS